jgi:hypothetical protein
VKVCRRPWSWGGGSGESSEAGRDFLRRIVEHFWSRIQNQNSG